MFQTAWAAKLPNDAAPCQTALTQGSRLDLWGRETLSLQPECDDPITLHALGMHGEDQIEHVVAKFLQRGNVSKCTRSSNEADKVDDEGEGARVSKLSNW